MDLDFLLAREKIIKLTRDFFYSQKFHEVIPEILNDSIPLEPNLYSFSCFWNLPSKKTELFLPASPERYIKKMLALGLSNCFAIGHCFRNLEGSGSLHNPEFLMLEWYRENSGYEDIIEDIKRYLIYLVKKLNLDFSINSINDWKIISLEDEFNKIGIDYKKIIEDENELFKIAKIKGYDINKATWRELFDQIFVNEIESNFSSEPFFLVDFPAKTSPLCSVSPDKPYLARRFEFYLKKVEIANGNDENTKFLQIKSAFEKEIQWREEKGLKSQPIDTVFLESIKKMALSGKKYAGVGLGIERLTMLLVGKDKIKENDFLKLK